MQTTAFSPSSAIWNQWSNNRSLSKLRGISILPKGLLGVIRPSPTSGTTNACLSFTHRKTAIILLGELLGMASWFQHRKLTPPQQRGTTHNRSEIKHKDQQMPSLPLTVKHRSTHTCKTHLPCTDKVTRLDGSGPRVVLHVL